jgi:hypothetical protein
MTVAVILGRRHGASRQDDPVLIAGPTYSFDAIASQFKRDFCLSRENAEFEQVWLFTGSEEKSVKFAPSKAAASIKAEIKKGKRKNEEA